MRSASGLFNDTTKYDATSGFVNGVVHDCLPIFVNAKNKAAGIITTQDLEVPKGSEELSFLRPTPVRAATAPLVPGP
jgi:hypothetical protein